MSNIRLDGNNINNVLELHEKWLRNEPGGKLADLCDADMSGASLSGAELCDANLRGADLSGANLRDAELWACAGNRKQIRSLFISDVYSITYTSEHLQIGCKRYSIKDWWEFDDKKILEMDGKRALKFWRENKEFIKMAIEKFPATQTPHNTNDNN